VFYRPHALESVNCELCPSASEVTTTHHMALFKPDDYYWLPVNKIKYFLNATING